MWYYKNVSKTMNAALLMGVCIFTVTTKAYFTNDAVSI
jgi:hypothetical protein